MKKTMTTAILSILLSGLLCLTGCSGSDSESFPWDLSGRETTAAEETTKMPEEPATDRPSEAQTEPTTEEPVGIGPTPELKYKETEDENLDDLREYVSALEQGLVDEEGCVVSYTALQMLVDRFYEDVKSAKEKGVYQEIHKNEDSVMVLLHSDLLYIYAPTVKGFLSGSGSGAEIKVLVVDSTDSQQYPEVEAFNKDPNYPNDLEGRKEIAAEFEEAGEVNPFETFENSDCDIDAFMKIKEPGHRVIYIGGHGLFVSGLNAWGSKRHNYMEGDCATFIMTEMIYDRKHRSQYEQLGLLRVVGQNGHLFLTPSFFRSLSDGQYLDNSIVYLNSCEGARERMENDTIKALLEKGADVVIGYDHPVQMLYDYAYFGEFIKNILDHEKEELTFNEIRYYAAIRAENDVDVLLNKQTVHNLTNSYQYIDKKYYESEACIFGEWADYTVRAWKDKRSVYREAYQYYADFLDQHRTSIGYRFSNPSDPLNRAVAFYNVWGDDVPEMLFCMERDADWQPGVKFYSDLYCITWKDGSPWYITDKGLQELKTEPEPLCKELTYQIADGGGFALYSIKNEKGLRLVTSSGDTRSKYTYRSFIQNGDTGITEKDSFSKVTEYQMGKPSSTYESGGASIPEVDFNILFEDFMNQETLGALLMTTKNNPAGIPDMGLPSYEAGEQIGLGMTYQEALAYLLQQIKSNSESGTEDHGESEELYAGILDYISKQISEGWKNENAEMSFKYCLDEIWYKKNCELGYSFLDLNEDGRDEMVLLTRRTTDDQGLEVKELNLYGLSDNGIICLEKNSAHYYFRLNEDKTILRADIYGGKEICKLDADGKWVTVKTKEDPAPMEFEFIPFSE